MEDLISQKLKGFFNKFKPLEYSKKEIIIHAEDEPSGFYFLEKGYVKFYSISEDGEELTLNIFKPGSYFPVIWAIGEMPNKYYFEAMVDCLIRRAPKNEVINFIKSDSEILFELTKRLAIGLGGLSQRMEQLYFGSAGNKVASVIFVSGLRFGEKRKDGSVLINLPLTHQTIASLAGLTRETTSLEVKKLERERFISYEKNQIAIKNFKDLEKKSLIEGINSSEND